ncbi:MAG: ribosome small subunit-dependent GTPase A [Gemmatimonadetes bacterium]|nr:ribosome small subunit-dependent GTPase A [Gemmatimonadota bacterium]
MSNSPLRKLGYNPFFDSSFHRLHNPKLIPARVVVQHRDRYCVAGAAGELDAALSGRLRHLTPNASDLPAVGDWVAVHPSSGVSRIEHCLDRSSCLVRQAAGIKTEAQVLAANLDRVFVVTSLNEEFNPRRLERYAVAIESSGAECVVVLSKADLCADPQGLVALVIERLPRNEVCIVSSHQSIGLDAVRALVPFGVSVAFVGSSGVGKSTIINALLGEERQLVRKIRADDARGRHTTTRRELILLPEGGAVIDTPGMRELQLWVSGEETTVEMDDIDALAEQCRYRNCRHEHEPGCAVLAAIDNGELDADSYNNRRKLEREIKRQATKQDALATRARRKLWARRTRAARARSRRRQ